MHEGRGSGVVIATGVETEFGVIFSMMQDVCTFCFSAKLKLTYAYIR